jgi:hypothetical protein
MRKYSGTERRGKSFFLVNTVSAVHTSERSYDGHDSRNEKLSGMGRNPPKEGDMKSILTKGKVVMAGLIGDKAIFEAMRMNEADTNTAYERAVNFEGVAIQHARRVRGVGWKMSGVIANGYWRRSRSSEATAAGAASHRKPALPSSILSRPS